MREQPVSINSHKTFICNQIFFLYSRNQGDLCAPFLGWKDHLYAKLLPAASCRSQDGGAQSERFQWVWLQASTARIWHLYHLSESGVRRGAPLALDIHYRLFFRVTIAVGFFCVLRSDEENFCATVPKDGRSYSPTLFSQTVRVLKKINKPGDMIVAFGFLADKIKVSLFAKDKK